MTLASPQPIGVGAFPDALRLVASDPTDQPAVERYHRWLADPSSASVDDVRSGLGTYAPIVDVVAFTVGLVDAPPVDDAELPGELRALVLSAQAAALVAERPDEAADLLRTGAAVAPPELAGTLLGNAGSLTGSRADLERALELLGETSPEMRAEIHHALGGLAHQAALADGVHLHEAMGHYYAALKLVSEASAPLLWASVQLDLAAAQLASPMKEATDQLRIGVAAQALRACRRVFTPAEHPGPWSTATLDLANALVYLPSTHQGDNLVEAVELYEEVLASRIRESDAAGKARLLANQGNALAHLGIFDQASAKLAEARFLFEQVLDHDGAMTVRQVQDEIARARVGTGDELEDLGRKAEQMSRMPAEHTDARTSGMGVSAIPPEAQQRAKVTVLHRSVQAGEPR